MDGGLLMKTVLLINPNEIRPPVAPLGLEYISSFLSERGHNVVIYDMNIHEESLSSVIENIIPSGIRPEGIINAPSFNLKDFKPERGFINNLFYYKKGGMAGIETTRGCNRKCIYCADPLAKGSCVRFRAVEPVREEVQQLIGEGIAYYHLCDSEFNLSIEYTKSLCQALIDKGIGKRN